MDLGLRGGGVLFLILYHMYNLQVFAAPPTSFDEGDRYPNKAEIEVCGNIRDVITRNSGRYRKILVRNNNPEIEYLNEDCHRMTSRAKSKIDVLAAKVRNKWRGVKLKVILAWTDQTFDRTSLHYEGMFWHISLAQKCFKKHRIYIYVTPSSLKIVLYDY